MPVRVMPEEPTTCGEPEAPSFPEDLFEGLTAQQRDERLVLLRWLTDLETARKRAVQEKKPLLVFSTAGPLDGFV